MDSMDSTSRWLVGSSSTSRLARESVIMASASRDRSPPEQTSVRRCTVSPEKPKAPSRPWIWPRVQRGRRSLITSYTVVPIGTCARS